MGLVKEGDKYAVLTDIAGAEDHYGDMDFKVAGTRKGITALQMDIKIMGITPQIMREALEQARRGRLELLDTMDATICRSQRAEERVCAAHPTAMMIPTDKIRDLIGPGGKVIRGIIDATGVKIDVDDTGRVNVASSDADGLSRAIQMITDLTATPEIGKTYLGKVVRLAEFGAFVEIFPGTDGLLHVSEIAEHRVKEVKDELREGDQILVKVLAIEGNRIKLSRKAVLREQRAKLGLPEIPESSEGGSDRGDRMVIVLIVADVLSAVSVLSVAIVGDRGPRGGGDFNRQPVAPAPAIAAAAEPELDGNDDDDDLDDEDVEGDDEPNFNRADAPAAAPGTPAAAGGARPEGRGARPGGRRRRGGRRPGQGGGGNGGGNRPPQA